MLFRPDEIQLPAEPAKQKPRKHQDGAINDRPHRIDTVLTRSVQLDRLQTLIPGISPGQSIHVVAAGQWCNFDLLEHLGNLVGPAELWLSTWGISDPGVRAIDRMLKRGIVTTCNALVDNHTAIQHSGATAFLRDVSTNFGVLKCHAKAYVLLGDQLAVSLITSANLTRNPLLEAGVVTESRPIAEFHRDWIGRALRQAPPWEPHA